MTVTTVSALMRLVGRDPGRPRLTWYGDDGERVELSGAVLENWVNKTTNLLVEELDVEPGARVLLDLAPHWRTVVWALSVWRAGAGVALAGTPDVGGRPDVVVTDQPGHHDKAAHVVVVTPAALARRYPGDLPAGAIDAAAAIMTYADQLGWEPIVDPTATALESQQTLVRHAELGAWAEGRAGAAPGRPRLLVTSGGSRVSDVIDLLRSAWDAMTQDGSVVVVPAAADQAALERLAQTERVTIMGHQLE